MTPSDSSIARDGAMNSADVAAHKTVLRAGLLTARNALTDSERNDATGRIGMHVLNWVSRGGVKTLAVYSPMRGEPDLKDTWRAVAAAGIELALPVVVAIDAPLNFVAWEPGQAMVRDGFGVKIPALPQRPVIPQAILIPCLGITPQRVRLGYGGGFYDRTLAALPMATAVGIAFDCCRTDFKAQAHDIALHTVITESGLF
jgi:5-formyltetrahydrofolate cyclo-ligase